MDDEEQPPTYRFKWSNIDLKQYVESVRAKAEIMRRKAAILIAQAEAIEDVAASLSQDLIAQEESSPFSAVQLDDGWGLFDTRCRLLVRNKTNGEIVRFQSLLDAETADTRRL